MRITRSPARKERKSKILELAKGFRGRKKNCYALAVDMVVRKLKYEYRDRRKKKSQMRALWIMRLNAAVRQHGLNYSTFMHKMSISEKYKPLNNNRKTLSEMAIRNPKLFDEIIQDIKG